MRRTILAALLLLLPGLAGAQSSDYIRYYPPSGLSQLSASATAITSTLPLWLPNGTTGAPALSFTSAPTLGMWVTGTGALQFKAYANTYFGDLGGVLALVQGQTGVVMGANGGGAATYQVAYTANSFRVLSGVGIGWSSDAADAYTNAADTILWRDGAANTIAQKNGNADQFSRLYGANGGYWEHGVNSELLTVAVAASTDTTGNLLPANAIIEAVVVRVTAIIPTAATFIVGDATTAARFATGVLVAADTTAVGLLHRHPDVAAAAGPVQVAAAKVRITPNAQPTSPVGVVRIEVFFSRFVPPTS